MKHKQFRFIDRKTFPMFKLADHYFKWIGGPDKDDHPLVKYFEWTLRPHDWDALHSNRPQREQA
ncbi:hypothetical protein [Tsukamurella strandjordii]|uniref:Uncharacterized protein n=1 Tax=Tsukamurella strandjordii TaxID=147577 RepID=A0AA90NG62_9ACTN|nr:hypothetical protein [Tsukamurella strandjordii]MDP0398533.1 hypothetical protein [Tsukamurella strandjordii]